MVFLFLSSHINHLGPFFWCFIFHLTTVPCRDGVNSNLKKPSLPHSNKSDDFLHRWLCLILHDSVPVTVSLATVFKIKNVPSHTPCSPNLFLQHLLPLRYYIFYLHYFIIFLSTVYYNISFMKEGIFKNCGLCIAVILVTKMAHGTLWVFINFWWINVCLC